jgi:predicted metal-dependent peptidase
VIDVVIDTSASVSDAELNQALTEVAAIMRGHAAQHPLRVRWCDASATQGLFLTAGNLRDVFATARGGGGTDIAAGIAAAAHDTPRPGIIIALTDGRTAWPPRPPLLGPHYIAAVFDTGTPPMTPPPWLTSIRIPVPTAALNR